MSEIIRMPGWFYVMTTKCRDAAWIEHKKNPMSDFDLGLDLSKRIWEEMSKPKNAKKIECVKNLIKAAEPCFHDLQKILECDTEEEMCKACRLEQALMPFMRTRDE